MFSKLRDPISGLTHLFGAVISLVGMLVLINNCSIVGKTNNILAFVIFGLSLIGLYTASSVYHMVNNISKKAIKMLRKLDHSMIFVLIAGTYTPICIITLKGAIGNILLAVIWSMAILGIVSKLFWFNAPRWLYTLMYVVMGWVAVFVLAPLARILPISGIAWLVAGGVLYTVGALVYALKWPIKNAKYFGFHEIFHIFVLMGSFCHYWLMLKYVLYL